jgi:hypothetical protein
VRIWRFEPTPTLRFYFIYLYRKMGVDFLCVYGGLSQPLLCDFILYIYIAKWGSIFCAYMEVWAFSGDSDRAFLGCKKISLTGHSRSLLTIFFITKPMYACRGPLFDFMHLVHHFPSLQIIFLHDFLINAT